MTKKVVNAFMQFCQFAKNEDTHGMIEVIKTKRFRDGVAEIKDKYPPVFAELSRLIQELDDTGDEVKMELSDATMRFLSSINRELANDEP